jgi:hypothetical protein
MARECIFCGESGKKTKEQYWPQWLGRMDYREGDAQVHWLSNQIDADAGPVFGESRRPISTLKNTLSRVCASCNNGWMSRLQEAAKPLLVELFQGRWPKMTRRDCSVLARWATMFAMVVEFADPKTVAVSQAQRTHFMNSDQPAALFKIWMGRFAKYSNNDCGFYHRASVITHKERRGHLQPTSTPTCSPSARFSSMSSQGKTTTRSHTVI